MKNTTFCCCEIKTRFAASKIWNMKQIQWYENKMHPAQYSTRLLLDIRLRLVDTPVIGYWAIEVTLQLKSTFRRNTNSKIVSFSFILSFRSMDGWGGYPPPHHSLLFKHWTLGPTSPLLANTQIQTQEIHKYTPRKYTNTHSGNTLFHKTSSGSL